MQFAIRSVIASSPLLLGLNDRVIA